MLIQEIVHCVWEATSYLLHDACRDHKIEAKSEATTTSHMARNYIRRSVTILLATARIRVTDRNGMLHHARALIDQVSETSFISEALAQKLRLPRKNATVAVIRECCVGGNQTGVARGRVTIKVMSHFEDSELSVTTLVLPRLTEYTGGSNVTAHPGPTWRV